MSLRKYAIYDISLYHVPVLCYCLPMPYRTYAMLYLCYFQYLFQLFHTYNHLFHSHINHHINYGILIGMCNDYLHSNSGATVKLVIRGYSKSALYHRCPLVSGSFQRKALNGEENMDISMNLCLLVPYL